MKSNIYPPEEEEILYSIVSEKMANMEFLSGHFNAKLNAVDGRMNQLQEIIRTMAVQYHKINYIIRDFEVMLAVMGDEERKRFSYVDIDRMREDQKNRLDSIRMVLTVPLPGKSNTTWVRQKEVV